MAASIASRALISPERMRAANPVASRSPRASEADELGVADGGLAQAASPLSAAAFAISARRESGKTMP
jgi:hypothetical protein